MKPLLPLFDVTAKAPSLCDKLAAYFTARPGQWIDGLELAKVAGSYAWRSRCSDLRKPPYGMVIENRVRHCKANDGFKWKVSEYRYVKAAQSSAA